MNIKDKILSPKFLWHTGVVALFVAVSCIYFYPALKGYSVNAGDVRNWVGMSQEIKDYRDNAGQQVLWTNAMFSGMPSTQISMQYPGGEFILMVKNAFSLWLPQPISFLFAFFLSFYIMACSLKIKPLFGALGAIAYGFSTYFIVIIEAGHNTKAIALGYAPLLIAGFILAYRGKRWLTGITLSALFMAMEVSANHLQITYYFGFILLGLGIVELVRHLQKQKLIKFAKVSAAMLAAYGLALLMNIGNITGTQEYAKHTIRGGSDLAEFVEKDSTAIQQGEPEMVDDGGNLSIDYITHWSYGKGETFTFLVPNYKGGKSVAMGSNEDNKDHLKEATGQFKQYVAQSSQYWGDQPFTSGPVYAGSFLCLLAFLALFYVKERYIWPLLVVSFVAVLLSWGSNLIGFTEFWVNSFSGYTNSKTIMWLCIFGLLAAGSFYFWTHRKKQLGDVDWRGDALSWIVMILGCVFMTFLCFVLLSPLYGSFRTVTMILVIVEFAIPLLAILFLQRLYKHREKIAENLKPFYIVTGVMLLILLIMAVAPSTVNTFLSQAELDQSANILDPNQLAAVEGYQADLEAVRTSIFKADVWRSILFLVLGAGAVFAFIRKLYRVEVLAALLIIFGLADLMTVNKRYLGNEEQGKGFTQWQESYKRTYPYVAGNAENQIYQMETQANPEIATKVETALAELRQGFDDEMSGTEKQRRLDWLKFRILSRNTNYRVYEINNLTSSSYTSYFHKSIGGYHGAKLSRYQDLIENQLMKNNRAVQSMLNMKYVITPTADQRGAINGSQLIEINNEAKGNAWFIQEVKVAENAMEEMNALNSNMSFDMTIQSVTPVFINGQQAQGAAKLRGSERVEFWNFTVGPDLQPKVDTTEIPMPYANITPGQVITYFKDTTGLLKWDFVGNVDTTFDRIVTLETTGREGFDPNTQAIVGKDFSEGIEGKTYTGEGTIEMTSYHPEELTYTSNSTSEQLAVFSEIYYPLGWNATIDGAPADIKRVNYTLRALEVPAGEHTIQFSYEVESYNSAGTIMWISTIVLILLLGFTIYQEWKAAGEEPALATAGGSSDGDDDSAEEAAEEETED